MIDRAGKALRLPVRAARAAAWTSVVMGSLRARQVWLTSGNDDETRNRYLRRWAEGLLALAGVDATVLGEPPPRSTVSRLVISNHRSAIDVLLLARELGGAFLSRGDLAAWPIVGLTARATDTIFVDRDSTTSRASALRHIRRRLAEGRNVTVFPEGTTYPGDEVREFAGGVFAAARGLDVEIVPVGLAYPAGAEFTEESFIDHVKNVGGRTSMRAAMAIGEPRPAAGSPREVAAAMRTEVQRLVGAARRALD